jgi:hypothetical protein
MKFDLAYCLSLDDKLSIYDVRDLNFDETVAFERVGYVQRQERELRAHAALQESAHYAACGGLSVCEFEGFSVWR